MYDVFISHSSKDKPRIVLKLVEEIKKKGLDVWLDSEEIVAGDTIQTQIEKGISNAICTVLIVTPAFLESFWTPLEIGLTLAQKEKHSIIPIFYDAENSQILQRFPVLFSLKYLKLESDKIDLCANELYENVSKLKKRKELVSSEYLLKKAIRNFGGYDTPSANAINILLNDYLQIVEINVHAALSIIPQIAATIINDLFKDIETKSTDIGSSCDKLELIRKHVNENIYGHLKLLCTSASDTQMTLMTSDTDRRKLVEMSLAFAIEWYSKYLLRNKLILPDQLEIVWPDELKYSDFVTMYEIDKLVLRSDLIAPPSITYAWYKYNNYTHIAIRSTVTQKIVGYFTVLPVTEQLYESIQSGFFKDNDLSTENLRKYDIPDFYKLYVACVCIHPDYQNTAAFSKLYNALLRLMMELAVEREIYVTDIITEASTPQGEKFCKILGLKRLLNTEIDTKIYGATLLPPSWQLKSFFGGKLMKFYREKYEELKELF